MPICRKCGREFWWKQRKRDGRWIPVTSGGAPHWLYCVASKELRAQWADRTTQKKHLKSI